ncbi:MAG TPA: thiamine pyrophosphate-binding protein [Acidimicrobiales bacterium]|nr:thiamine pyrophosphate-binding protein [Acidimicrobiales bacterium]
MTSGRDVLFEVLESEGVDHIFGNPGTTELPLMDALAMRDRPGYVLALQEATAVGMADGYAQATGRPAFLNLHTSAGLGNAIGNLTNAQANGVGLVVTAGQQDRRHLAHDPMLSGDLVALARPVSKWSDEIHSVDDLGLMLRRAFRDAGTAPRAPVFLSLPMDLLDDTTEVGTPPVSAVDHATVAGGLDQLAGLLLDTSPGKLCVVAADDVHDSPGGLEALIALAEGLAAPVFGSPLHGRLVFPPAHPLWQGALPPFASMIASRLEPFDRVLQVGGQAFRVYPYTPGSPLPASTELLHLSPDASQIGRAHPATLGVVGDPGASLRALHQLVSSRMTADRGRLAADALRECATRRRSDLDALEATATDRYSDSPMHPMAAAHALLRALPPDSTVVDEAVTTGVYLRGFHHADKPGRYFFCKGGGLGWGMPAACGISLARGREPVLCVVGDGSAMYSPQALWTAAHYELPVVFAVVNNRQYRILKDYLRGMGGDSATSDKFVAMDLTKPAVDFLALAQSMGVGATLVEKADDVGDAVRAAWSEGRPQVLELPISAG